MHQHRRRSFSHSSIWYFLLALMVALSPMEAWAALGSEANQLWLYRVDVRVPFNSLTEQTPGIFQTGFVPWGSRMSLVDHVASTRARRQESGDGFVGTTESWREALAIARGALNGFQPGQPIRWNVYIYRIRATENFYGVNASLRRLHDDLRNGAHFYNNRLLRANIVSSVRTYYQHQVEWVSPGTIPNDLLYGSIGFTNGGAGEVYPNLTEQRVFNTYENYVNNLNEIPWNRNNNYRNPSPGQWSSGNNEPYANPLIRDFDMNAVRDHLAGSASVDGQPEEPLTTDIGCWSFQPRSSSSIKLVSSTSDGKIVCPFISFSHDDYVLKDFPYQNGFNEVLGVFTSKVTEFKLKINSAVQSTPVVRFERDPGIVAKYDNYWKFKFDPNYGGFEITDLTGQTIMCDTDSGDVVPRKKKDLSSSSDHQKCEWQIWMDLWADGTSIGFYFIQNIYTEKFLTADASGSTSFDRFAKSKGIATENSDLVANVSQRIHFTGLEDADFGNGITDVVLASHEHHTQMLDASNKQFSGAGALLWEFSTGSSVVNQRFNITRDPATGFYRIYNTHPNGYPVAISQDNPDQDGAWLVSYAPEDIRRPYTDLWRIVKANKLLYPKAGPYSYQLFNVYSGKAFDATYANGNCSCATQWSWLDDADRYQQLWVIAPYDPQFTSSASQKKYFPNN